MKNLIVYFVSVTVISCSMFAAVYFEKQAERLCVQEAIKANYLVKDIKALCGGSYIRLGDKE